MVKLRLTRIGTKKKPYYRIVAMHSRNKRDGEIIELVGTYAPLENNKYTINEEVALKWLKEGAQPTDTVRSIFKREGIMKKFRDTKAKTTVKKVVKKVATVKKVDVAKKVPAAKKATTKVSKEVEKTTTKALPKKTVKKEVK